jgi:hypothetical protein
VEEDQTMVVAGSVNFLMKRRKRENSGCGGDFAFLLLILSRDIDGLGMSCVSASCSRERRLEQKAGVRLNH